MKNAIALQKEASASLVDSNDIQPTVPSYTIDPIRYLELWKKVFQILHGNPKI